MCRRVIVLLAAGVIVVGAGPACKNACWSCLGDALSQIPLQGQPPPPAPNSYAPQDAARKVCYTNTITVVNQTNHDYQIKLDGYMVGWITRFGRVVFQSQISGPHLIQVKDSDQRWSPVHNINLDCQYQPNYNYFINYY